MLSVGVPCYTNSGQHHAVCTLAFCPVESSSKLSPRQLSERETPASYNTMLGASIPSKALPLAAGSSSLTAEALIFVSCQSAVVSTYYAIERTKGNPSVSYSLYNPFLLQVSATTSRLHRQVDALLGNALFVF
jgi:hypothetical protein